METKTNEDLSRNDNSGGGGGDDRKSRTAGNKRDRSGRVTDFPHNSRGKSNNDLSRNVTENVAPVRGSGVSDDSGCEPHAAPNDHQAEAVENGDKKAKGSGKAKHQKGAGGEQETRSAAETVETDESQD